MRDRKLFTNLTTASAVLLVSTFAFVEKAEAWGWYGFSDLCVAGETKGPEGSVISFALEDVVVELQCRNTNTDNFDQPGVGNAGTVFITGNPVGDPDKQKGVVSIPLDEACLDLGLYDDHAGDDNDDNPGHLTPENREMYHFCKPQDNVNKEEVLDSALIRSFTAKWNWKNDKGRIIRAGTDSCTWPGERNADGLPEHRRAFNCECFVNSKRVEDCYEPADFQDLLYATE